MCDPQDFLSHISAVPLIWLWACFFSKAVIWGSAILQFSNFCRTESFTWKQPNYLTLDSCIPNNSCPIITPVVLETITPLKDKKNIISMNNQFRVPQIIVLWFCLASFVLHICKSWNVCDISKSLVSALLASAMEPINSMKWLPIKAVI